CPSSRRERIPSSAVASAGAERTAVQVAAGAVAARVRRVGFDAGRLRPRALVFLVELFFGCVCVAVETAGAGAGDVGPTGAADAGSMAERATSETRTAAAAAR